jgi:hypothetical protein
VINHSFKKVVEILISWFLGILSSNWLPGSPFVLYDIFSGESLARVKNQLEVLNRVLVSESKYAVVKVSNGEFVKL